MPFRSSHVHLSPATSSASDTLPASSRVRIPMSTPIILGVGAIAAAIAGRSLVRRGILGGRGAAQEWAKGGFKAKMDRKEALAVLGIKCVPRSTFRLRCISALCCIPGMVRF